MCLVKYVHSTFVFKMVLLQMQQKKRLKLVNPWLRFVWVELFLSAFKGPHLEIKYCSILVFTLVKFPDTICPVSQTRPKTSLY